MENKQTKINQIRTLAGAVLALAGVALGSSKADGYIGGETCEISGGNGAYTYEFRNSGVSNFLMQYEPYNSSRLKVLAQESIPIYLNKKETISIMPFLGIGTVTEDRSGKTDLAATIGGGAGLYADVIRKQNYKLSLFMSAGYEGEVPSSSRTARPARKSLGVEATCALVRDERENAYKIGISPFFSCIDEGAGNAFKYGLEARIRDYFIRAERDSMKGDRFSVGVLFGAEKNEYEDHESEGKDE